MDCCVPTTANESERQPETALRTRCARCEGASRFIAKKTMLLMLRPGVYERIGAGQYYYCSTPDCEIVYFLEAGGEVFLKDDLRVRVGAKEKNDPKPICYCFGFDESDIHDEIARTGRTEIPGRIVELVKAGMCACDTRNPSGACCLGEITKVVKRIQKNER